MRIRVGLVLGALLIARTAPAAEHNQLTAAQASDGWVQLFDGRSLAGWRPTSKVDWRVEDGVLRASTGGEGWLMSTCEFGDFQLHVEFLAPPSTNSGVFFRTPLAPTDPARDCYELNIAPADNPFPTGSLVGRRRWAGAAEPPSAADAAASAPAWQAFDVTARGGLIAISLDGVKLYEYRDAAPLPRGHVGLQFRVGPVAFRNVRIKPAE